MAVVGDEWTEQRRRWGQERRTPRQAETDGRGKEKRSRLRPAFVAPPSLAAHFSPESSSPTETKS